MRCMRRTPGSEKSVTAEARLMNSSVETSASSKAAPRIPLFPEIGVVGLVPDKWDSPWTVRHHVMTRLGRYFQLVWVNPAPPWRDCWLGRSGLMSPSDVSRQPGFAVYNPGRLEAKFHRPVIVARAAERRRLAKARKTLTERGCERIIVYLWRPEFGAALDLIEHEASCYHVDDEYSFSPTEQPTDEREIRLLKHADHVFIHSPALWAKKAAYNAGAHLIPTGADYRSFAAPRTEPADLRAVPRPRIGYVGYIKGQLDFPLIARLALAHREWSFVFVGPQNANMPRYASQLDALSRLPNVYMLGGRPVGELPAYVQHMDVLTLGYRINDYTKFICPMKLNEYLASGRPVVGSPIPCLKLFSDVVALAETPEQWSAALTDALRLAASSRRRVDQRRRVARQYDWGRIVLRIAWTICGSLGDYYVRRITEAHGPPPQFIGRGYDETTPAAAGAQIAATSTSQGGARRPQ